MHSNFEIRSATGKILGKIHTSQWSGLFTPAVQMKKLGGVAPDL